jgi:thiamine pyrophosphokinase
MEATEPMTTPAGGERRAVIVADGDSDREHLRDLVAADPRPLLIAADGGARALLALGLRPDLVIGDGDSLPEADRRRLLDAGVELRLASPAKDESDTELCVLAAIDAGATAIAIHGGFGGDRPEHSLANLLLLADRRLDGREVELRVGSSRIVGMGTAAAGARLDIAGAAGDYVSLFAVAGPVRGIRTSGLRFPLLDETLIVGPARGLSNELTRSEARVETAAGRLLVVITPRDGADHPADQGDQR